MEFKRIKNKDLNPKVCYDVKEYGSKTVSDFIEEVIAERPKEWGYINVQKPTDKWFNCPMVYYRYGEVMSVFSEDLGLLNIDKVNAMKLCNRMDYWLHIKS